MNRESRQLAAAVLELLGPTECDASLDCDNRLREMAQAILSPGIVERQFAEAVLTYVGNSPDDREDKRLRRLAHGVLSKSGGAR